MAKKLPALSDSDFDEKQSKVMDLFTKSYTYHQIAKKLNMTQGEVKTYVDFWRDSTRGNQFLKDRVNDLINTLDDHYSKLIQKQYEVIDEVDEIMSSGVEEKLVAALLSQKTSAISKIADYESKRVDVLQRAGILEVNDIGDQLIEMEAKHAQIIRILQEVASEFPAVRMQIAAKLQELTNEPQAIPAPEVTNG